MTTLRRQRQVKLSEVRVLKREDLTPELMLMWVEKPEGYTFKAGQYCTIGLDGIERAYSISSAPYEDSLELFVELVHLEDGGVLTPKLWELSVGDSMTIRPRAKGIFTFDPAYPDQLLVATVTGIVPYVSFLRQYLHDNQQGHHFYILMGASYHDEFAYDGELRELEARRPDLVTFVPTVSRPSDPHNRDWKGESGRVNTLIEKYVEKFGFSPERALVYACGHPGMIEAVKDLMKPMGYTVKEERFWKED